MLKNNIMIKCKYMEKPHKLGKNRDPDGIKSHNFLRLGFSGFVFLQYLHLNCLMQNVSSLFLAIQFQDTI